MNYDMHKLQNFLIELINMLVTTELSMKDSKGSVFAMKLTSFKRVFWKEEKVHEKVEGGWWEEEEGIAEEEGC